MVGNTGAFVNLNKAGSNKGYILGKSTSGAGWTDTFYVSNAYFQSGVLYEGSDERWKTFVGDVDVDFEELTKIPKKYYVLKSEKNGSTQIGTSAQELVKVYPEIVSVDENGYMSVAYDRLSIIALSAIDKLSAEVEKLKERISNIESR